MKTVLASIVAILLLACSTPAPAPAPDPSPIPTFTAKPYHRFYQGYRLPNLDAATFAKVMNDTFLPLFPLAHPVGLKAYRPALPLDSVDCELPDQVALLTFDGEPAYDHYRETEIGKKIREAHTLVFTPKSSTLVPTDYKGTVKFDHAYSLKPAFLEFMTTPSVLYIHCEPKLKGDKLLAGIKKSYAKKTVADEIVFAVTSNHVIEYVFANPEITPEITTDALFAEAKLRFADTHSKHLRVFLKKDKIGGSPIKVNRGLDVQL